jgi:hypothetical protein
MPAPMSHVRLSTQPPSINVHKADLDVSNGTSHSATVTVSTQETVHHLLHSTPAQAQLFIATLRVSRPHRTAPMIREGGGSTLFCRLASSILLRKLILTGTL